MLLGKLFPSSYDRSSLRLQNVIPKPVSCQEKGREKERERESVKEIDR
jgi:hypothetical protein